MKRWSATLLVFAVCSAIVHADVTIVQKTTVEGGAAAAMGGNAPTPTVTTRIKGMKGRTDMDMGANSPIPTNISTITDAAAKEVTILDHNQKTARVSVPGQKPAAPAVTGPTVDTSIKSTGKSQTIDGFKCDEFTFTTSMAMSSIAGASLPPEAAEMMKDITMVVKGSLWVTKDAPGSTEYLDYQKAMSAADLAAAAMGASGMNMPGMDKMMKAMQGVQGLPILTEMDMTIEGTGQMADMMRQMGAMRITTKVLSVKTDPVAEETFKVPAGYQVVK